MKNVFDFIHKLFSDSVLTGFIGVFVGAILNYIFQIDLNNKQKKHIIESKALEELMNRTNTLALNISENNLQYKRNRTSNELRNHIEILKIENADKLNILNIINIRNNENLDIMECINKFIIFFKLNSVPLYRLTNFRKKIEKLFVRFLNQIDEYHNNISKLMKMIENDEVISIEYVEEISFNEISMSRTLDEILFYLTDLDIIVQNELYRKTYNITVKRMENSKYQKIEILDKKPSIIDIEYNCEN